MTQQVELAAIVVRDGKLLFLRRGGATGWDLPGGPLPADADIDDAMDGMLTRLGVNAPAVEDDFLQTTYLQRGGQHVVLNLYGPSEWTGEPAAPEGYEAGWFSLDEVEGLPMDDQVRKAVLGVFGIGEDEPAEERILDAVRSAIPMELGTNGAKQSFSSRREAGLDVLGTLNATKGEKAARGMYDMYGELTDDVLEFALGGVWADPTLDRKTKSLQVVAMIATQGHVGPLRSHINGALNHGATPEELAQTMRLVAVYAGFPAALEAWRVLDKVLAGRGIKLKGALT